MASVLFIAYLALLTPALSANGRDKAVAKHAERMESVHAYMDDAFARARSVRPGAVLLGISGSGPLSAKVSDKHRFTWKFAFIDLSDDPLLLFYQYREGTLRERGVTPGRWEPEGRKHYLSKGIKRTFVNGKPEHEVWNGEKWKASNIFSDVDVSECAPISAPFLDTPDIVSVLERIGFRPSSVRDLYHLALLHPLYGGCTGGHLWFGKDTGVSEIWPIPKRLFRRNLWVAYNGDSVAYFDAKTGEKLYSRKR